MLAIVKGFFLLNLAIIGVILVYLSWLFLLPVSESDVEYRISNVCYAGQMIGAAVNGDRHQQISCDCVRQKLTGAMTLTTMAKGADVMRQLAVTQMYRIVRGEKPANYDQRAMADRDVLTFVLMVQSVDKGCGVKSMAAAAR